jgi:hypothetical protein
MKLTGTNRYVLGVLARRIDAGDTLTRIEAIHYAHARRLVTAGLLAVTPSGVTVTSEGRKVLALDDEARRGYGAENDRKDR